MPIVFTPVSVNDIFGRGAGPFVWEADQSSTDGAVVVESLVNSADMARDGYAYAEMPSSATGNDENPAELPERTEFDSGAPVASAMRTSAVVPGGVSIFADRIPHPLR